MDAQDPVKLNDQGVDLFNASNFDEALRLFDLALMINPQFGKAWANKANCLFMMGRHMDALSTYERAVEFAPLAADIWFSKAFAEKAASNMTPGTAIYSRARDSAGMFKALADPTSQKDFIAKANEIQKALSAMGIKPAQPEAYAWLIKGYKAAGDKGDFKLALTCMERAIEASPEVARAWFFKALCQLQMGNTEGAIASFQKATALDELCAVYWFSMARAYGAANKNDDALNCYIKAIDIDQSYFEAWSNAGRLYWRSLRHAEASRCFTHARALNPDSPIVLLNSAMLADELGDVQTAHDCFKRFAEVSPERYKDDIARARARAEELSAKLKSQTPEPEALGRELINTAIDLKDNNMLDQAVQCLDQAIILDISDKLKSLALTNKGAMMDMLKRHDHAIACHDEALLLDSSNLSAWLNKGGSLHSKGKLNEALACYDKALSVDPNLALAHANKAKLLNDLKNSDGAIASAERAIALDATLGLAWLNKGVALFRKNRLQEALAACENAITLEPNDPATHYNKGLCLAQTNRPQEALQCFQRATSLDPKHYTSWCQQARCYIAMRLAIEALQSAEKAITLHPKYALPWYFKSYALLNIGDKKAALEGFERFTQMDTAKSSTWYKDAVSIIAELQQSN